MGAAVGVGGTTVESTGSTMGRGVAGPVGVSTGVTRGVGCDVGVGAGGVAGDSVVAGKEVGGSVGSAPGLGTGWKQAARVKTITTSAMRSAKLTGFNRGAPSDHSGWTPMWATHKGNYCSSGVQGEAEKE